MSEYTTNPNRNTSRRTVTSLARRALAAVATRVEQTKQGIPRRGHSEAFRAADAQAEGSTKQIMDLVRRDANFNTGKQFGASVHHTEGYGSEGGHVSWRLGFEGGKAAKHERPGVMINKDGGKIKFPVLGGKYPMEINGVSLSVDAMGPDAKPSSTMNVKWFSNGYHKKDMTTQIKFDDKGEVTAILLDQVNNKGYRLSPRQLRPDDSERDASNFADIQAAVPGLLAELDGLTQYQENPYEVAA